MKSIIDQELKPIMIGLFNRMKEEGLSLEIDGIPAFNLQAQFVGGKVINASCYAALELIETEESLAALSGMIHMVSGMRMETWGILNALSGLYRLHTNGILDQVVDSETLELLKQVLDWRTFVDAENNYALIHKPANYYGVAVGAARYRELLGWETEEHSSRLLTRLFEHIDQYSGELCFMDETSGQGRFDRYSILVPGELAALFLRTGMEISEKIRIMLEKSCHLFLQLANKEGIGFAYGRSIGAYGCTAILEVFSAAAEIGGILTEEEMEIAYGYSVQIMKHVIHFWYDKEMDSVNMWEKGRKTDQYRNKNRILGENLSLCMQMFQSYEHWKQAGFENREICEDFADKLKKLDKFAYFLFAEGQYKRGLAIVRDGKHIWSLPLIHGGKDYYDKDAYMPVPFQNFVLQGVPGECHGQLVPQLIMENGKRYMPLAYTTSIVPCITEDYMAITCEYNGVCQMGEFPQKISDISDKVTYTFCKNCIRREDVFTFHSDIRIKEVKLVLLAYSKKPELKEAVVEFAEGVLARMTAKGYGNCSSICVSGNGTYDTPQGRLGSEVVWRSGQIFSRSELRLEWVIEYR